LGGGAVQPPQIDLFSSVERSTLPDTPVCSMLLDRRAKEP
jgi:hypothetical protein